MEDLEKIFGQEKETPTQPSEPASKEPAPVEKKPEDIELVKKQEQLSNLEKAIQEAETELKKKREAKKTIQPQEEELPKIDMTDPGSKAWDKHISEKVNPLQTELDKAKAERREFALRTFLSGRPDIASNADKMKKLMDTYERIKSSSELTSEGILIDIERAYVADNYRDILATQDSREFEKARAESEASAIGVSRGATAYTSQRDNSKIPLSEDDKAVLAKWGMKEEEWQALKKKHA